MHHLKPETSCCALCGRFLPAGALVCPDCTFQGALDLEVQGRTGQSAEEREPRAAAAQAALGGAQVFGDYELLEEIARGGMGIVYKARQKSLGRTVALKVMLSGQFAQPAFVQRFRAEGAAIAQLQHPNIVAIHEFGEQAGQPYFSMDFVEGRTLAEIVRQGPMSVRRAATYLKTIAEAVHYAHQRGILHRDLKPSNILIDRADQPRITDFGLAKRLTADSELTLTGQVLGSPNYLSPEQAAGRQAAVGPGSDVYSLGALLYHLVTGRPPFQADSLTTLLREVIETEPLAPRLLNASLPRDLETICLKCLEKEPARRYASAQAVADELGRFLEKKPILARPVGLAGKTWRWCRRKPALATALGAVVLVAAVGFVGILTQWQRAEEQRRSAQVNELLSRQNAYAADMNSLQGALEKGDLGGALAMLEAQRPGPGQRDLRGWEWRYFWQRCRSDERFTLCRYSNSITALAFSADGKWLALRRERGAVGLWDTVTRKSVAEFPEAGGSKMALALSPQGHLLAYGSSATNRNPGVSLWNVAGGNVTWLPHAATVRHLAFSPDGTLLATLAEDSQVRLWRIESRQAITNLEVSTPRSDFHGRILFSPDGRLVALAGERGIRLWEWASGRQRLIPALNPGDGVTVLALSADGKRLAATSGAADNLIYVWDLANVRDVLTDPEVPQVGHLVGHQKWIADLAFAPDGQTLASASGDQTVRLWNLKRMQEIGRYQGNTHEVWAVAFSPDGKDLVSGGRDGSVRYWDPIQKPPIPSHTVLPIPVWCPAFAFAPDGQRFIALDSTDGSASLWDTATVQPLEPLTFLGTNNSAVEWSPDGRLLAVGDRLGHLRVWDFLARHNITNFTLEGTRIAALIFHGRGRSLWCGAIFRAPGGVRTGRVWNVADWREVPLPAEVGKGGAWSTISPDNRLLASLTMDGTVAWWDFPPRRKLAEFKHHFASVDGYLAFSPDSRILAGCATEGLATLWDVASGQVVATTRGNVRATRGVAFSPDGQRLLTGGSDATDVVRLMDLASKRYVARLSGPPDDYWVVDMSSDGNTLVAVGMNGTTLLWHAPSWTEIEAAEKGGARP